MKQTERTIFEEVLWFWEERNWEVDYQKLTVQTSVPVLASSDILLHARFDLNPDEDEIIFGFCLEMDRALSETALCIVDSLEELLRQKQFQFQFIAPRTLILQSCFGYPELCKEDPSSIIEKVEYVLRDGCFFHHTLVYLLEGVRLKHFRIQHSPPSDRHTKEICVSLQEVTAFCTSGFFEVEHYAPTSVHRMN